MKNMYPDTVKYFPPNTPPPRGNLVQVSCFVERDHKDDKITRRSQSGNIF